MIDPVVGFLTGDEDGWVHSKVVLERVLAAGPEVHALRLLTVIDPQPLGSYGCSICRRWPRRRPG